MNAHFLQRLILFVIETKMFTSIHKTASGFPNACITIPFHCRINEEKYTQNARTDVTQIKEILQWGMTLANETVENCQNAVHRAAQGFAVVVLW